MNIFRILSSFDGSINEPNVSSFLAYLLDPSEDHGLSGLLLQELLGEFLKQDKTVFSKMTYLNRITDLSRLSRFSINIIPEFPVYLNRENSKKKRDIDILIEISETSSDKPLYSICIENKITDGSIIKNDSQLEEELEGLKNYYTETSSNPEIYLIYLTPYPSEKSAESFSKLSYDKKIHMFWNNDIDEENSIFYKLNTIFKDESMGVIDPINDQSMYLIKSFQSFIRTGFKSYIEEKKERQEKNSYGKPVIDYLGEYADTLSADNTYSIEDIREGLASYVKKMSGIELHKATRNAHILLSTVNDKNRAHYGVKDPADKRKNLFYYPDTAQNKKDLKKFVPSVNRDVHIYFKDVETNETIYK